MSFYFDPFSDVEAMSYCSVDFFLVFLEFFEVLVLLKLVTPVRRTLFEQVTPVTP